MKPEFKIISKLIDENSFVLDVGCGDGILMEFLIKEKKVNIRGIEISKDKVQNCIAKGLTIIEGNAENDLKQFPDKSFDYVILSQTLQAFLNPEKVINELLRIGKQAIVTIPNFGYWKIRLHLLIKGTMPVTKRYLMNGIILQIFTCVQSKTLFPLVKKKILDYQNLLP